MKKLTLLFFASLVVLLTACPSNDPDKSEEDIAKENLSVTWKVTTLPSSSPAGSFSDDFKQITMTFNSTGTYSLTKPNSVPYSAAPANKASGSWKFNAALTQVILDEGTTDTKTLNIGTLNTGNFIFDFAGKAPTKYVDAATITYTMVP
jgi:hypothetical protein